MTPAAPLRSRCLFNLVVATVATLILLAPARASAQLGALASPGPLAGAHATLEGLANCQRCHEPGRQVSAAKCLSCHEPIRSRIARKKGVHRDVTTDCVTCHVEHAGVAADLRPLDTKSFAHGDETGFALDGLHAKLKTSCGSCHETRSFLTTKPECASCHADPHKGTMKAGCATCHTTAVPFREAAQRFDHSKSAFPLTGKHQSVPCAQCHKTKQFTDLSTVTCASCHKTPHPTRFATDCASCHTTSLWKTNKVDHARTAFPLVGAHQRVDCVKCHARPATRVKPKAARCADCHADPHKGQFKAQGCDACHDPTTFSKPRGFDHARQTGFGLTGKHAAVECSKCHKAAGPSGATNPRRVVDFKGASKVCASCHTDVHKGELGTTCDTCHGTESFVVKTFTHPGQAAFYEGGHAAVACLRCHQPTPPQQPMRTGAFLAGARFKGTPTTCSSCHADIHLGQVGLACERCHAVDSVDFAPSEFTHDAATFALTGKHRDVACVACHKVERSAFPTGTGEARRLTGIRTDCIACHGDVHLGQLGATCITCHSTAAFAVKSFTHKGLSHLFEGAHAKLECAQCHRRADGVFPTGRGTAVRFKTGTECSACHADTHRGAMGPACSSCHSPDTWRSPSTAFHKLTTFPLEGQHLAVPCRDCHVNGQVKGTPTTCYACHWIRRQDDRYARQLGSECGDCHRPTSWSAARFDHGAHTGTPLNASHRQLACASCHKTQPFAAARPECLSCHESDFERVTDPNHVAAGFPTDCTVCHAPASPTFAGARFTHESYTLVGRHAAQTCASCHKGSVYKGTSRECVGCHQADYQRTASPNHAAAGFPVACDICHRATDPSWKGATFSHNQFFALQGTHSTASCANCHKNNVYRGLSRDCVTCHQADYQRAANPNHVTAGLPTACESCHRNGGPGWTGAAFSHNQYYTLSGSHSTAACASCHKNGVYKGDSRDCASCHLPQYQATNSPNHVAAGFTTACDACHRSGGPGWLGAAINHTQFYPLLGRHSTASCASCHTNGVYRGTPRTCVPCHDPDYRRAVNPNHVSAGFPTTCESCHREGGPGWTPSTFNHSTYYALQGRHASLSCTSCHATGVYRGTSRDCVGCHRAAYDATKNPSHRAASFPTTCDTCHRAADTSWSQGRFTHTWFPITSGKHANRQCSECHQDPNNYKSFTCITCHSRTETDKDHQGKSGYRYDSLACYSCHPEGRE